MISLSSAERGSLVTIAAYTNATVTDVPPLLVFPRRNKKAELLDSAPPGSLATVNMAGWIQKESFTQRFKHFVRFVKPFKKRSHFPDRGWSVLSVEEYRGDRLCSGKRVHIVCLPPHSTHKLQPLGVPFIAASEDIPRIGDRNLAEKPTKHSFHTLSNYWTG
jgi:hypothetical protein